jgi:hypothetical protein
MLLLLSCSPLVKYRHHPISLISPLSSEEVQRFQYWFDQYCKNTFVNCMNNYNDYSQPLIIAEEFINYRNLLKMIFPQQWHFLAVTGGIHTRDGQELNEYNERQTFMVLLNLQGLANFRCLMHRAMVISMAFYGWVSKDTVGHATSSLGFTVTRTTQDAFFKQLTNNVV